MSRASAVALAVAVWLGTALGGPWWLALLGPVALAVVVRWRSRAGRSERPGRRPRRDRLLLVALAVAAATGGAGLAGGRAAMRDTAWLPATTAAQPREIVAVVASEPRAGPFDHWMVVRIRRIGPISVRARSLLRARHPPPLGATVRTTGWVRALDDEAFSQHVRALGAGTTIVTAGPVDTIAPPGPVLRGTGAIRDRFRENARTTLGADRASILTGLVTGDDRGRGEVVDDLLTEAGLRHLVVVSGRHTALFLAAVLGLARLTRRNFRSSRLFALVALGWFVVLVRWEPSVLRAAVVAGVVLVADLVGRDRDHLHLLAMAVVVLLLADPLLAGRVGFALSVSATTGVLVLAPAVTAWLPGPPWLRSAVGVTLAAQVAVAPVLVAGDLYVPVAGLVANLLAAPAAAAGQALGGLAALVTLVSPAAGAAVIRVAGVAVDAVLWSAGVAVRVVPPVTPSSGRVILVIVGVGAAVTLAAVTGRRRMPRLVVVVVLLVALAPAPPAGDVPALTVTALDVGQGDAVLVASPADGGTQRLLVDAGPDAGVVTRYLAARGIRRLEAVAITHAHADHSGGVADVLRRLEVGVLLVGPTELGAGADRSGDALAARAAARGAGTSVVPLHAGRSFRLGDARVRVLWPPRDHAGLSANDTSLVLRIDSAWGSVLLTGDVEAPAQQTLLDQRAPLDVDVLKVPHHGGATNAPAFLDHTSPEVAIVSVGLDNDYGHPAGSTIRALAATPTLRTDHHGEVTVVLGPGGVRAVTTVGRDPPG